MRRFRERFEIKNEVKDDPKIRNEFGGKASEVTSADVDIEGEKIGFDDMETDDAIVEVKKNDKYREQISSVMSEIDEYFDETVSESEIKLYVVDKIKSIYGKDLEGTNILIDQLVEGYIEDNGFEGAESFENIANAVEGFIERTKKIEGKDDPLNLRNQVVDETTLLENDVKRSEEERVGFNNDRRHSDLSEDDQTR